MAGVCECGTEMDVNPVKNPNVDWVTVVCAECGRTQDLSMIRLEKKHLEVKN